MIGIYKITNLINNKSYIGQSVDIQRRWSRHRNYNLFQTDYPLYRAFEKYGIKNFNFEVLEECSIQELDSKEIMYIQHYDSYNNGYNQTTGGQGSCNSIIKISNEDLMIIYDLLQNTVISQRDIAEEFNVGEDTISEINNGKTRIQAGYIYPLRQTKHPKTYCMDCGIEITHNAKRCDICNKKTQRIVERPSREELKNLIRNTSFLQIGKQFNVSDNAIRKWCDSYNLPRHKRVIKNYTDEEWNDI